MFSVSPQCPVVGVCVSVHRLQGEGLWWLSAVYGTSRVSLLCSFSRTLLFGPPTQCQAWVPSRGQRGGLLPRCPCHCYASVSFKQPASVDHRVCGQVDGCLFPSDSMQSTFQYHEHQSIGLKALGRHKFNISMFIKWCRCCFQQHSLTACL